MAKLKMPEWMQEYIDDGTIQIPGEKTAKNLESWFNSSTNYDINSVKACIEMDIQTTVRTLITLHENNHLV